MPPGDARDAAIDLSGVLHDALRAVHEHRRGHGFTRFADSAADLYGTADAVGILATLARLDPTSGETARLAEVLRALQQPDGRFVDDSHGAMHSTATGVGALYLLGEPVRRPSFLEPLFDPSALGPFLDGLDWANPWLASHDAAGLAAIASMAGATQPDWFETYFAWLDEHVDASTGLWPAGGIGRLDEWPGFFGNLGCSFHLHFLLLHHARPIPYAAEVVDSCLTIAAGTRAVFGAGSFGYPQLDWAYSLGRASRQSSHRGVDARDALRALSVELRSSTALRDTTDLHTVGAVVALVAELSAALGDEIVTGSPTRPTTDLRPFI